MYQEEKSKRRLGVDLHVLGKTSAWLHLRSLLGFERSGILLRDVGGLGCRLFLRYAELVGGFRGRIWGRTYLWKNRLNFSASSVALMTTIFSGL